MRATGAHENPRPGRRRPWLCPVCPPGSTGARCGRKRAEAAHFMPTYSMRIRPSQKMGMETPAHREAHDHPVQPAPPVDRGQGAHDDPGGNGPDQAGEHKLQGGPQGHTQFAGHLGVADEGSGPGRRAAPGSGTGRTGTYQGLSRPRSWRMAAMVFRRGGGAGQDGGRIGGHHLQQGEAHQEHPEDDRYGNEQSIQDLPGQSPLSVNEVPGKASGAATSAQSTRGSSLLRPLGRAGAFQPGRPPHRCGSFLPWVRGATAPRTLCLKTVLVIASTAPKPLPGPSGSDPRGPFRHSGEE